MKEEKGREISKIAGFSVINQIVSIIVGGYQANVAAPIVANSVFFFQSTNGNQ